jgi:hypothetical protein
VVLAVDLTIVVAKEQISLILGWMIEGLREEEIERRISQEMPAVTRGRLLAAVAERLRQAAQCERDVAVGFALEAFRDLYAKAVTVGDLGQARGAIKDWITLALRHNVLDDEETEGDEAANVGDVEAGDEGSSASKKRRAVPTAKPKPSRRPRPTLRKPGPPKTP